MKLKSLALILGLSMSLQSCVFVAGAAAGAAAIAVVYDHRTIANSVQDNDLAMQINEKLNGSPLLKDSHVSATVFNRVVLLTGEAPSQRAREEAQNLAQTVPNIGKIYNQITIQGPTSSLTRTSDSWITTKIKAQMLTVEDLKSSSIKVVTENGTVFLMGIVTKEQADTSVDIARQVSGVQKVIKVFQYKN